MLHPTDQTQEQPAKRWPRDDAAGDGEQEGWRDRLMEKPIGGDRAYRESINQQRARVVQQTLAFEDGQQALRRPQPAKHRCRRGGVRRSDDGAERDRRCP